MADQNNKIKTTVELDATNAQIEINKLNAVASDSTRKLEERVAAKNKQVELQEKLSKKTISNLEKEIKALDGVAGSEKKVEALTKKLNATKIRLSKISDQNTKAQNRLNSSLKKSKGAAKGLGGAFGSATSSIGGMIPMLNKLKLSLISSGIGAFVVALGSAISLMSEAIKKGAEFSKGLSGLKAVSAATNKEINILSSQAKELGATTAFTAIEVVKLQTELSKLGFSVSEIEKSTPSILDLSSSLEVSLADAALLAGSTIRSFGMSTVETQRVVDVLAKSTSSSALNFTGLTESLKIVAPVSRAVGVDIEKTTALLGVLADSGLKGSVAGTGLSKTFIELNRKGVSLEDALKKVSSSSNQLNEAIELVGVVGAKSLLNLANSGNKVEELTGKLKGADGAARSISETRLDNLTGDVTKLSSAWEGFLLGLEDGSGILNKIGRGAIQALTKYIQVLKFQFELFDFVISDIVDSFKVFASSGVTFVLGSFDKMRGSISLFANSAILAISKIPILGSAIDKNSVNRNIEEARGLIELGAKKVALASENVEKLFEDKKNFRQRFIDKRNIKNAEATARRIAEAKAKAGEALDKSRTKVDSKGSSDDPEIKRARAIEKALIDIEKSKIARMKLNGEDVFNLQRSLLDRQMKYELSALELTESHKDAIREKFETKRLELKLKRDAENEEKRALEESTQQELDALEIERKREKGERTLELELELLERKRLQDVAAKDLTESQIQAINERAQLEKSRLKDAELQVDKKAKETIVSNALDGAAEVFGITQEVAVAKMIMAAPEAVANSFKTASAQYAPPMSGIMGALGAATVIVPIIKGLNDIKKARFGKKKGGGGGSISSSVGGGGVSTSAISDLSANNASRLGVDPSLGINSEASAANRLSGSSSSNVVFSESRYSDFQRQTEFREDRSTV